MELLGFLMLLEKRSIELQSSRQVIQSLLIVLIVKVCLSQLGVGTNQNE
jgi:hypothetical protein